MSEPIPMTRAGYEKIKSELDQLHQVELPKILERIATARDEGDLSENAEFQYSQESRMHMEARIAALRDKLSRARIIDPSKIDTDEVAFGATVKLKDLELDDEEEYTLVGAGEEDYAAGRILFTSPLGRGMAGAKVGQKLEIEVPQGTLRFEVLEISYGA